jgi:hypothetical protein
MSDEPDREDALNRFWNALVRGERHAGESDLRPEDVEVAQRLQRAGAAPFAGSSAEEAWPRVLARIEATRVAQGDAMPLLNRAEGATPALIPDGRVGGKLIPIVQPRQWLWGQAATAALLLVTLVVSAFAFGWTRQEHSRRPESLPAVIASPAAETSVETLFTTTLSAEEIPNVEPTGLVLRSFLIDPGPREPAAPAMPPAAAGLQITHVIQGDLTLTVEGPLQVHHGAMSGDTTSVEQMTPGTEITLHAGDTAVYDTDRPVKFANLGADTVKVVSGGYLAGTVAWLPSYDDRFTFIDSTDVYPVNPPLRGPVEATLERVTLAPGAVTAHIPNGSVLVQVGADEDVSIGETSDGSLRNINPRAVSIYAFVLTPLGAAAGPPATEPPRDAAPQDP